MTCSGYMTAAVAVNRYLDIIGVAQKCICKNGYIQALIIFTISTCVNIPRWLEFDYEIKSVQQNVTLNNGTIVIIEEQRARAFATKLREKNDYVRDYTLISATVLIVILPTLIMLIR